MASASASISSASATTSATGAAVPSFSATRGARVAAAMSPQPSAKVSASILPLIFVG